MGGMLPNALNARLSGGRMGPLYAGFQFNPLSLFIQGEQGALYLVDPQTLYTTSTGETQVAADGDPVGMMLDGRNGYERGIEALTNNEFTDGGTGWTVTGEDATHTVTFSGGTARYQSDTTTPVLALGQSVLTIGEWYEVTVVTSVVTSGSLKTDSFGPSGSPTTIAIPASVGSYTFISRATTSSFEIVRNTSNVDITLDSISIKTLSGNHATQSTSADRLVYNTLTKEWLTFDRLSDHITAAAGGGGTTGILLVAGIRPSGTTTARTLWSDTGSNTGYKLTLNASDQIVLSAGNGTAYTSVTGPVLTDGTDYVIVAWHDGTNLNIQVNNGAITSAAFATATAGTDQFTVGKDNNAASGYFGSRLYNLIYRKNDTSSASQRNQAARYTARLSGVGL